MIIASDLDRTLIYSNRAIDEYGRPNETIFKCVENHEGKWMSFMTNSSFNSLEALCREYLFVPITTRTTEQYKRIFIFRQELSPRFAITANGATILHNGEPMEEWSELLSAKLKNETAPLSEIGSILQGEELLLDSERKQVDELFFYFILRTPLAIEEKHRLTTLMKVFGWNVSLQGRKLYLIPKAINKGAALEFVCSYSGEQALAGAGDSVLDLDFLGSCRNCFVPNHGELVQDPGILIPQGIIVTKNRGVLAGEEILKEFLLL